MMPRGATGMPDEKRRWPIAVQILIQRRLEDVLPYSQDVFHTSSGAVSAGSSTPTTAGVKQRFAALRPGIRRTPT